MFPTDCPTNVLDAPGPKVYTFRQVKTMKRLLSALLFAGVLAFGAPGAVAAPKPNILLIVTDDLGWGDLGVLFQNQRAARHDRTQPAELTPNLDRLAAQGVRLTDHYCAAPVCAPSRASLLLGLSQGHAHVRDNQFDKALDANHTLATVLRQAGYATVAVGKWGLPGGRQTDAEDTVAAAPPGPPDWPAAPTRRGFTDYFGYLLHADGHEHYPKEAPYTAHQKSKTVWAGTTNLTPSLDKCYTADLWTAWAKQWILQHTKTQPGQPFFMYLAYDTPHAVQELPTQSYPAGGGLSGGLQWLGTPGHMITTASGTIDSWVHPDYRAATYDDDHNPATPEVAWPDVYKRYATAVRRLDDAVADLRSLLADLHLDQDTLVLFTSDNGPSIESYLPRQPLRADFFASYGPFDGIKRDCWEGGLRVPALAVWPGHFPAGRVVTTPSISYDWLRTFAAVAGLPAPAETDGMSLLPALTGSGGAPASRYLYVEYFEGGRTPNYSQFSPGHRGRQRGQMQALRSGDYVGVRYDIQSAADPFEIYHVTTDPRESVNLAASQPALQEQFQALSLQARRPNPSAPRPYDQELVPALPPGPWLPGVHWQAYTGDFPWVPDFATLTPVAAGTAARPGLDPLPPAPGAGLYFTGALQIPTAGDYTFYLETAGGAVLRLHDATVINADFDQPADPATRRGSIRLQAGLHPFRLYYARAHPPGQPARKWYWSGPGLPKALIPPTAFRQRP